MLIGFLAWLELLLESGPPGPKRVPHGRPVKQTNLLSVYYAVVYSSPDKSRALNINIIQLFHIHVDIVPTLSGIPK